MRVHFFDAPVLGLAAVAHEGIPYDRVKADVDQCGGEQNAESPEDVGVVPGDRAADDADNNEPDAQTLRKIFANEQFGARAGKAAFDAVAFEGSSVDGDLALAVRASKFGRVCIEMGADPFVAGRASVSDVHESLGVGS